MLPMYGLILLCVVMNVSAQVMMKTGMQQIGGFAFTSANIVPIGWKMMTNPLIFFSLFLCAASVVSWLLVLSRMDISLAYPMVSIGYALTALMGWLLFNEQVTPERILGIGVIMLGVYLISRSA